MHFIPTTQTQIDKIKDRAKALRSQFERLGHARDAAAKEIGYSDFHHAILCATQTAAQRASSNSTFASSDGRIINAAVDRIADLLAGDPAVKLNNKQILDAIEASKGIELAALLTKANEAENPMFFYSESVTDFNAFVSADFPPTISNKSKAQFDNGYRVWASLLDEKNSNQHKLIYAYSFLKVYACYTSGLRQMARGSQNYLTTERLLKTMSFLMGCRDLSEASEFLDGPGDELMPTEMNISIRSGDKDLEKPSTWWSRIQAMVAIEMAGVCSIIPFEIISKFVAEGKTGKLPFVALYRPANEEIRHSYMRDAKIQWEAIQ